VYTFAKRNKATLLNVLTRLNPLIKRDFNTTITFLIADDKKGYGLTDDSARAYCYREGIDSRLEHYTLSNRTDLPNT
jgi:hypothetical protein